MVIKTSDNFIESINYEKVLERIENLEPLSSKDKEILYELGKSIKSITNSLKFYTKSINTLMPSNLDKTFIFDSINYMFDNKQLFDLEPSTVRRYFRKCTSIYTDISKMFSLLAEDEKEVYDKITAPFINVTKHFQYVIDDSTGSLAGVVTDAYYLRKYKDISTNNVVIEISKNWTKNSKTVYLDVIDNKLNSISRKLVQIGYISEEDFFEYLSMNKVASKLFKIVFNNCISVK